MAEPGAPSAVIAQITTTSGLGAYTLGMPIRDKLPLNAAYIDGETITYLVTDTSGTSEVTTGVFTSPDSLSRDTLVLSSTGSFIDWPASGQRVVTPLIRFPICDTVPTVGQVLEWNGTEWCPATLEDSSSVARVCPTPPLDGQVLIWSVAENAYCPADFCALVTACTTPAFSYGAVTFDGVTYLDNFPAMTDSPRGFISVWLKGSNIFNSRDNGWLFKGPDFFCYADQYAYGANTWFFQMWDSPTNISEFQWASATPMSTSAWVNVLMAWDMDVSGSQVFQLFFNDTQIMPHISGELGGSPPEDSFTWPATFGPMPFTIAYSTPDSDPFNWRWGDSMSVDMAEAVFAPGQFLDFTNSTNRAKFRDSVTGHPVSLGSNGSLPTGVAPTLYLHISGAETNADNFATNLSGAGSLNIVTVGGLTIAPTKP